MSGAIFGLLVVLPSLIVWVVISLTLDRRMKEIERRQEEHDDILREHKRYMRQLNEDVGELTRSNRS